jgi:hypothetical protein
LMRWSFLCGFGTGRGKEDFSASAFVSGVKIKARAVFGSDWSFSEADILIERCDMFDFLWEVCAVLVGVPVTLQT